MMKIHKNLIWASAGVLLFIASSCSKAEIPTHNDDDNDNTAPRTISLLADVEEGKQSRALWTEDTSNDTILLFNWEDDQSGSMKSAILGKEGIKSFVSGNTASTHIYTTSERNKSKLSITSTLTEDFAYEQDDQIHCFYPTTGNDVQLSDIESGFKYTFSTPQNVRQEKANTTEHLRPYIYMWGKGNISVSGQNASSEIQCNVLPAVIQYRLTNKEEHSLTIQGISLTGSLALHGELQLSKDKKENIVYTEQQHTVTVESNLTIVPQQTVNFYTLLLPTQFTDKEMLRFNLKSKYSNGWTANYVDIPVDCKTFTPNLKFSSNRFYTIDVDVTRDEINMTLGGVSIKHAQKGEDIDIEIGPKQ